MIELHPPPDRLGMYAEGVLPWDQDREVERHIMECGECAAFVDGYARLFLELEGSDCEPGLEAAVARLDARMRPYLEPETLAWRSRAQELLRRLLPGLELVHLVREQLAELLRTRPELPLVWLNGESEARAEDGGPGEELTLETRALRSDGTEERGTAYLSETPRWPACVLELMLEFELGYIGWEVAVIYLLDEGDYGRPLGLTLFDGVVDAEGLVDFRAAWPGAAPKEFDPRRLRITLAEPTTRAA